MGGGLGSIKLLLPLMWRPNNQELQAELPFISMQIVDQAGFDVFVNQFFATDRDTIPKGMLEVLP